MRRTSRLVALFGVALVALLLQGGAAEEEATTNAVQIDGSTPDSIDLPPWLLPEELERAKGGKNVTNTIKAVPEAPAKEAEKVDKEYKRDDKAVDNANARTVFTNIVIRPDRGQKKQIGIKNTGQSGVDLKGWRITNSEEKDSGYVFGKKPCQGNTIIPAGGVSEYFFESSFPCSLNFTLSKGDTLSLYDDKEKLKANLKVDFSGPGEWRLSPNGNYWSIPYTGDMTVMTLLDKLGQFKKFTEMLSHFDYDRALKGQGRRSWQNCSPVAYPPYYACSTAYDDEYDIYYRNGPFTVFAPTDAAMNKMLADVGGPYAPALTVEEFVNLDDGNMARQLLQYHVIKGSELTSQTRPSSQNSTYEFTHFPSHRNNSEIVAYGASHQRLWIHEDCVESHTPDEFGCGQQKEWGKCGEDWINDEGLFSKRELGYCEITCGKCKCTPETCHLVPLPDLQAKNGVVHVIDHVFEVPPLFDVYEPPPPPEPEEPSPRDILNRFPSYGDLGLTETREDTSRTIEDLIELYLMSRRADREAEQTRESAGGSLVLDGLGRR
mmetsp:Transcript_7400/g.18989  ORF Transcript_7400/g.18989 Transcript_7400/m.18989 type:complete len:548 (+) Transcript_7400:237-1880(+)|eukprot:CAMPEP_0198241478 /NCGR_PEP_ID=MMETSP1446-20131203/6266_1 /TAXON_ID=1461542 ORGANISM="Unidentified sp, Strain CCMP2111" /NCGR_SAMPLE_ID=MMETSP1446 /ASSEMBLY_ACC=CAM_ASM_001112 /LENGTH=547 /DNA_ID=CAMNT_0043924333 /DNA_START=181 /DNA_END=1824 /DNA_ORIENTATION=-